MTDTSCRLRRCAGPDSCCPDASQPVESARGGHKRLQTGDFASRGFAGAGHASPMYKLRDGRGVPLAGGFA